MEVTSSTTTGTSSLGQDFNNGGNGGGDDDDQQQAQLLLQPISSDVVESGSQPLSLEIAHADESHLGASCVEVAEPLHYGPVMCPDFYQEASLSSYGKDVPDSRAVHGSCGLHNLGNTCFMNSGLQSLMSCSPLVRFFSENFTLDDSTGNTLTGHFYILLCKMWSGQFSVVHPKKFKEFLGLYHSQFEDYRQHDCQEFLAFLLDTLHEQLNEGTQPNNYLQLSSSSSSSLAISADAVASPTAPSGCALTDVDPTLSAASSSSMTVSCSETELSKQRDNVYHSKGDRHRHCDIVDNCSGGGSSPPPPSRIEEINSGVESGLDGKLVDSSELRIGCEGGKLLLDSSCRAGSNAIGGSHSNSNPCQYKGDILTAGEQHQSNITLQRLRVNSGEAASVFKGGDDNDDSDLITSSGGSCGSAGSSSLKRFTSRSNLDDVSSSDIGFVVKPSLKRVSADTGVSASGLTCSSEDSNQSSLSVHSTDSEQSSTFKRLKIESSSLDLSSSSSSLSRSNSNCNSNNNGIVNGLKDFAVTSSSDCKLGNPKGQKGVSLSSVGAGLASGGVDDMLPRKGRSDESVVSGNLLFLADNSTGELIRESSSVGSVISSYVAMSIPDCQDDPMETSSPSSSPPSSDIITAKRQLQRLHSLEEFYKKETKTLNTNVLISDDSNMQEISCDSEKFAKVDNRHRLNSREINLLQEVFDEEDSSSKVDKILIGEQLAIKDTNLYTHPHLLNTSPHGDNNIKSGNKPMSTSHNNTIVLNNSYEEDHALSCHEALSISSKLQCASRDSKEVMMANDVAADFGKRGEAEKNIQMQAYTKFNTTPPKSNIRIDLTDNQAVSNTDNVEEVDNDSSDDDEIDKQRPSPPPHPHGASSNSSMESECSSIPNCLRTCLPWEVSMANEAWQRYKTANNSIVVGTFQGQFRSTVVCSECSHVSVTYEPFMYLSLPIPHAMEQQMCIVFISHGASPVRYLLNMMKTDKIGTCKKRLKEMMGLSGDVIMAEVLDSHVSRILDDNVLLKYVNVFNRKIYAFEVVCSPSHAMISSGGDVINGGNRLDRILLNNEDVHRNAVIQDDLCLVSTSRGDDSRTGLLLPYRTESQMSDQSLDSIHVNTPSSRDTMDLGFSDSEMCDDNASLSSPNHQQQHRFSPSCFRDDAGASFHISGNVDDDADDDDVCQSTTSDVKLCGNGSNSPWIGRNLTSETLSANAHCLSWQIVQEKDVDDCDETASTVTTVVGSSSSVNGDDIGAPCSSSSATKFWVDQPPSPHGNLIDNALKREESNGGLGRIESSTIADDDDYDAVDSEGDKGSSVNSSGNCTTSKDKCDSQLEGSNEEEICSSANGRSKTTTTTVGVASIANPSISSTVVIAAATTVTATHSMSDINNKSDINAKMVVVHNSRENDFDKVEVGHCRRDASIRERDLDRESNGIDVVNVDNNNIVITDTTSDDDNVAVGSGSGGGVHGKKHDAQSGNSPRLTRPEMSSAAGGVGDGDVVSRRLHQNRHAVVTTSASSSSSSSSSSLLIGGRIKDEGGEEEERPGSYFMQSPRLHAMDSICHTDSFGPSDGRPLMEEDAQAKCLTDNWTTFDLGDHHPVVDSLPVAPALSPPQCPGLAGHPMEEKHTPASLCDEWRSCAICLEDLPVSQLLTHVNCDGVFCQGCLDMSVKHTADVSFFCCPICLQPANVCEDFISLPTSETAKLQARLLTMCLAFRHLVIDNTGSSSLQLVGHPTIVEMASVIAGADLYNVVDRLITGRGRRVPQLTYSVMLTDGQGLNCSRCPYSAHCTGCQVAREGEVILRPSDNLTVHSCRMLSPDDVSEMQFAYDDPSMASLRSSEPTTIMDCFGAFTQSEILDEHNPWFCPRCERNQCAKKTMTVWRYPDNLIIHLKRFVYQDLSSTKVDTKVVFPHQGMDVRGFLSGPSSPGLTYDLYSVICHFGGASAGHYTSYALHPLTSQWYYYNDETVSLQSPQDNEYSSGYVLFYQRQGTCVDFTPPQYLPSMDSDIPAQVATLATATSTFHQQQASSSTTTSTSITSINNSGSSSSSSSSSKANNNSSSNNMALVLFVPPTSTTSSSTDETTTKNLPSPSGNEVTGNQQNSNVDSNSNGHDQNDEDDDDDDDDDDYDCERRCSPSSDYGSLPVHFGSVFPDPDENSNSNTHIMTMNEEIDSHSTTSDAAVRNDVNLGMSRPLLSHGGGSGSSSFGVDRYPSSLQEPDSTYDVMRLAFEY